MIVGFMTFSVLIASSLLFYVEAFKAGMNAKKWALGGLLLGPILFPMFNMKRYLLGRQLAGLNSPIFRA